MIDHPRLAENLEWGLELWPSLDRWGPLRGQTLSAPQLLHMQKPTRKLLTLQPRGLFTQQPHVSPEQVGGRGGGSEAGQTSPQVGQEPPSLQRPLQTWGLPQAGQCQGLCGYPGLCPSPTRTRFRLFLPLVLPSWDERVDPGSLCPTLTRAVPWVWVSGLTSEPAGGSAPLAPP